MILMHGTTKHRAEQILQAGPDPDFRELGGQASADGFSMAVAGGPFLFGHPAAYARSKAEQFPDEGGRAVLAVDVPDSIIGQTNTAWFPPGQGLVQFDVGAGLEALIAAWLLAKEIRSLQ